MAQFTRRAFGQGGLPSGFGFAPGEAVAASPLVAYAEAPMGVAEASFFAIDDYSIPFRHNLSLTMHAAEKHPENPVLLPGEPGMRDDYGCQFYGSILRDHGKLRMWHLAFDGECIASLTRDTYSGFAPRTRKAKMACIGRSRVSGWSITAGTAITTGFGWIRRTCVSPTWRCSTSRTIPIRRASKNPSSRPTLWRCRNSSSRDLQRWSAPTNKGEESDIPAAIWNRGNVRLGLLISNDGVHFREPIPNFILIPRGWDADVTVPDTHAAIGLATLRQDGFGSLSPKNPLRPRSS